MSVGGLTWTRYFENDLIKASPRGQRRSSAPALGVCSPGTAYVLLHHYMGDVDGQLSGAWGFARGGMGAVSAAPGEVCLQSFGGDDALCDANVAAQIMVRNGRATGVALARMVERIPRRHRGLQPGPEAHLPRRDVGIATCPMSDWSTPACEERFKHPGLLGQGEHRPGRAAQL